MRVLSKRQEKVLDLLLQIAAGDVALVERAFREASESPGVRPTLEEMVFFILEERGLSEIAARLRETYRAGV